MEASGYYGEAGVSRQQLAISDSLTVSARADRV